MNIIIQYDSSASNAPSGFKTAVQAAVNFIDHLIANNITTTIIFSWGVINGSQVTSIGQSQNTGFLYSYSDARSFLAGGVTSAADKQALSNVPQSDPTNGGIFYLTDPQLLALGQQVSTGPGYVGLENINNFTFDPNNRQQTGTYDAVGVLEHEITEVLGRDCQLGMSTVNSQKEYTLLDLFHYSAANVHAYTLANSSENDYFSVDGTHLLQKYNNPLNGGDGGDWDGALHGDSFGTSWEGTMGQVSPTDVLEMDLIGYKIALPRSTDFHNDGLSNLLIQNTSGAVYVGEVSGNTVNYETLGGLGSEWTFSGTGDFLGDGLSDILLQNTNGSVYVAEVGPNVSAAYTQVASLGHEWTIVGAGNLLGDGKYDMLILNTNGTVVVGEANPATSQMAYTSVASLGKEWTFVGVGDYLGEGHDQFLIQNTNGAVVTGDFVNGAAQYTSLAGLGKEWTFVGTGDFLGDGHVGFLIQNTNGAVVAGEVLSGHTVTFTTVGALGSEWKFVGVGDYTGVGHAEFLIQNTSGAVVVGNVVSGHAQYTIAGGLGSEWTFHR